MINFSGIVHTFLIKSLRLVFSFKNILFDGALRYVTAKYSFAGDGFATIHDVTFLSSPRFLLAWADAFEYLPPLPFHHHLKYRFHIAQFFASTAVCTDGIFLELGVNYGYTSRFLASYFQSDPRFTSRRFYLCDTWGGQLYRNHPSYQDDIFATVLKRFDRYPNIILNRGELPQSLDSIESSSIAYLFLDLNNASLELQILKSLWPRLSPRAVVIFDDCGWSFYDSSHRSNLEGFLNSVNQTLLHFPCGTSVLIKS
jgi:hypothetical protein